MGEGVGSTEGSKADQNFGTGNKDFISGSRGNKEMQSESQNQKVEQNPGARAPSAQADLVNLLKDLNKKFDDFNNKMTTKIDTIEKNYEELSGKLDRIQQPVNTETGNFGKNQQA